LNKWENIDDAAPRSQPASEDDSKAAPVVERKEDPEEAKMTVPELMEHEFKRIIGHDSIKQQLRAFYKKVQLDQIRAAAGRGGGKGSPPLYHMIFSGPPGTGKTTMANVVAKLFCKMKLTESDKVISSTTIH
jgi:Holliday junction resolvasome RuvABC ATP-dependent DNA helicase subunit